MRLVFIAVSLLWAVAAQATDLQPLQPLRHELDEDTSAMIVFAPGTDGFRVVATVQQATETENVVLRVTTVLLPGQWADIVAPRPPGEPQAAMRIVRDGNTLRVEPMPSVLSAR